MKKILSLFIFIAILYHCPAFAEKIPIRITPAQIISTHHDEVMLNDWIEFEAVSDVYKDKKIYIKEGTPVIGVVDFVHENGFENDLAEIKFQTFYVNDIDNNKIKINYPLTLNQRVVVKDNFKKLIKLNIASFFRGAEILVEPDTKTFNIFMEK